MNGIDMYLEPLRMFLRQAGDFLPRLGLAAVVVIAGWILAKMARFAIVRGLLLLAEIEKLLYELRYELANRPDWLHVPLRGALGLIGEDAYGESR